MRLFWNDYYNINNLPDYTWLKRNGFLALTTSSICSQIQLHSTSQWPHCLQMIQVGLSSASARKYRENLQFDRLKFEIWLLNIDHVEM